MPPAARVGDLHACGSAGHVGGPLSNGSETVQIGGAPAARLGDRATCQGPSDTVSQGSPTVFIEGRPAARAGDASLHSGMILTGCESVIIGNSSYAGGGTGGAGVSAETVGGPPAATAGGATPDTATVHGKKVSPQVLSSMVSIARAVTAGGGDQAGLGGLATALEVALARNDLSSIRDTATRLQGMLQKERNPPPDGQPAQAKAVGGAGAPARSTEPELGTTIADPPRRVAVIDGRPMVNDAYTGIHAISEFDLVALQAADHVHQVVQRLGMASAAGRNCARVFCMYRNAGGELSPLMPGYWKAVDAVIKRLTSYGMFAELVLFADCEPRPDGTGGVMPSWDARLAFAREAGLVLRGRPVIVNGMNAPARNGATGPDDPRLIEAMQAFREASAGTVPFSIGDPEAGTGGIESTREIQQSLAAAGASLIVMHSRRDAGGSEPYRAWIDRLADFDALRGSLAGNPYLYHNEPMGFASRSETARRDNDAEAAVAAACVCAIGQMGFCYHRVAAEDPATPGLDLARVATRIPQSPEFSPRRIGAADSPVASYDRHDAPGGAMTVCSNGQEAWAVLYGKKVAAKPRVEWRAMTPEVVWRGERVVLWRAT